MFVWPVSLLFLYITAMNFNKLHLLIKLAPCPYRTNFTLIKNGSYRVTAITHVQINDPLTCFHWLYFLSGFILLGLRSNTYIYNLLQINLNMRLVVIWSIEDSTLAAFFLETRGLHAASTREDRGTKMAISSNTTQSINLGESGPPEFCIPLHSTGSKGIWIERNHLEHPYPLVMAKIILVTVLSQVLHCFLKPLGQTKFVCNLLVC